MILIFHVLSALISMTFTTYLVFRPQKSLVIIHYGLVTATLTSGTYLIFHASAHLLETCIIGLAYLVFATYGSYVIRRRVLAPVTESLE